MNDIAKKESSSLTLLAQAIGGLNIMEPPEIPNDQWFLPRKLTKFKIRDLKEMSEMMANIYENNTRALNAKIGGAMAMMTASDRLKLEFKKIEHETQMLDLTKMEKQAQVKKIMLECELLEMDIKDARLSFKAKVKDMGEGYDTED